jgi:hypothetical protein
MFVGVSGLAVAAAGAFGLVTLQDGRDEGAKEVSSSVESAMAASEICLTADIDFLPGDQGRCFEPAEIAAWRLEPLVDAERGAMAVKMSSPDEAGGESAEPRTCREYNALRNEGWYASTSRDMRRDAFFVRACGVIEMLLRAQEATTNYFTDGGLEVGEVASISAERLLRLSSGKDETPFDPEVEQTGPGTWRAAFGGQTAYVEEIASLDFDGDGFAEILAFFAGGPERATARLSEIALLEKDAEGAPVTVTAIDFAKFSNSKAKT